MSTTRDAPRPRPFVLLGDPVAHSWSPAMHAAALVASGLRAVYQPRRCAPGEVEALMREAAERGGGGNVTIPHKLTAAAVLDAPSEAVVRTGACNTFWGAEKQLLGDNTDVAGIARALDLLLAGRPPRRALLLGAGGAARAAAAALADAGCEELLLWSRRPGSAPPVAAAFARAGVRELDNPHTEETVEIVVNATPLGMRPGDALPADPQRLRAGAALDLVYAAGGTDWQRRCAAAGIPAMDGREVLIAQAEAAFALWWGEAPPAGVMASALPSDA